MENPLDAFEVNKLKNKESEKDENNFERISVSSPFSMKRAYFSFRSKKKQEEKKPRSKGGKSGSVVNIDLNRLNLLNLKWDEINSQKKERAAPNGDLSNSDEDSKSSSSIDNKNDNNQIAHNVEMDKSKDLQSQSLKEDEKDANCLNSDVDRNAITLKANNDNEDNYDNITTEVPKLNKEQSTSRLLNIEHLQPSYDELYQNNQQMNNNNNLNKSNEINLNYADNDIKDNDNDNIKESPTNENQSKRKTVEMLNNKTEQKKQKNFSEFTTDVDNTKEESIQDYFPEIDIRAKVLEKLEKFAKNKKSQEKYFAHNKQYQYGIKKLVVEKVPKSQNKIKNYNKNNMIYISDSDMISKLNSAKENYVKSQQIQSYKKLIQNIIDNLMKTPITHDKKYNRAYEIMPNLLILKEKIEFISNETKIPISTNELSKSKTYLYLIKEFGIKPSFVYECKIKEKEFIDDMTFIPSKDPIEKKKQIYHFFEDYYKALTFLNQLYTKINYLYNKEK